MNKNLRKAIIAGNWKMNKTRPEAKELLEAIKPLVANADGKVEVIACVPFTNLETAVNTTAGSNVKVGAENCHFEKSGAFTGEISADMLVEVGVEYVVLKNTLVRRALQELNIEGLDEVLNGPSAFAFGMNDPVSPAKIINDFITKNKTEAISIKAGLLGSDIMTLDQIKNLAETPSREVLLARLVGSLQSSIAGFVRVLDAIAKKDTEAAPEA